MVSTYAEDTAHRAPGLADLHRMAMLLLAERCPGGPRSWCWALAAASGALMAERLHVLSDQEEEALLQEAGFSEIALFYAGLSFRGWVAVA